MSDGTSPSKSTDDQSQSRTGSKPPTLAKLEDAAHKESSKKLDSDDQSPQLVPTSAIATGSTKKQITKADSKATEAKTTITVTKLVEEIKPHLDEIINKVEKLENRWNPLVLLAAGFAPGFLLALIALLQSAKSKQDPAIQKLTEQAEANTALLDKISNRPERMGKIDPELMKITVPDSMKQEIIAAVKTIKPESVPAMVGLSETTFNAKMEELKKSIIAPKGGLPEGTLPAINKAADAIKAVDISSIKTLIAELQTKTKAEAESRLALEKAIAALQMAAGKVGSGATVSKPQDVWLIGLDSAKFTVKDYRQSFQDALGVFDRKAEATIRGGFGIARGDEFTVLGKPSDPMIKWNLVQPPPGGVVETPSGFGSSLKEQLDPARAKQRIILVGSIECPPLKSDTPGWSEIPEVHVVLVQKNKISAANERAALLDQLLAWQDFCHARKGTLTIIPDTNTDKPGRLKDVLQQLTKPE